MTELEKAVCQSVVDILNEDTLAPTGLFDQQVFEVTLEDGQHFEVLILYTKETGYVGMPHNPKEPGEA